MRTPQRNACKGRLPRLALLLACAAVPAVAEKPVVEIDLQAVDENGELTPASPLQGIIYLTEKYRALVMAQYFASGADKPCDLSGGFASMPQENRILGDHTEEGLHYVESPKTPGKIEFGVSCTNAEGTTTASSPWEFLPLPPPPDKTTDFKLAQYAPVFPGAPSEKGISIEYAIPGIGSSCMIWREKSVGSEWAPVDNESGFALYSLSAKEGISGSISYSVPPNTAYPYKERFLYSCLNPTLGVYADSKLIGVVTYRKPKAAKEAVVSIEMPH